MLTTYIRSSSYNNWDFCEMQYFITYVLGYQADTGKKTEVGTIVHKVLEMLAHLKQAAQTDVDILAVDDAIGQYRLEREKLLIPETVTELVQLSFDYYTGQSKHKWTKGDLKECLALSNTALSHNEGQYDPRYRNVLAPEPYFDILVEEDWAQYEYTDPESGQVCNGTLAIKGTIDLVTEIDEETLEIIDWKTGKRMNWATGEIKDFKYLQKDPQLLLYYYAAAKMYPQFKYILMSIFFIRDGGPFSLCFDEEHRVMFMEMLKNRFLEIKGSIRPKLLDPRRKNWKCTKLCHFCKTNWQDTNKSMCMYIDESIRKNGMDKTVQECTKPGFTIGHYSDPGANTNEPIKN